MGLGLHGGSLLGLHFYYMFVCLVVWQARMWGYFLGREFNGHAVLELERGSWDLTRISPSEVLIRGSRPEMFGVRSECARHLEIDQQRGGGFPPPASMMRVIVNDHGYRWTGPNLGMPDQTPSLWTSFRKFCVEMIRKRDLSIRRTAAE